MPPDIDKLIHNSGLFNETEKTQLASFFKVVLSRKSDPIFPKYIPNLAVTCLSLESIAKNNTYLKYPAGLSVLISNAHKNPRIMSGKRKYGTVSSETYPTYKLLVELSDERSWFYKLLTRLFVWDWVMDLNFQPNSKSKLAKALLDEGKLTDFAKRATDFLEKLSLDLDKDFLIIVAKFRSWCRTQTSKEFDKYTSDTLTKFIDALFLKFSEVELLGFEQIHQVGNGLNTADLIDDELATIDLLELKNALSSAKEKNESPTDPEDDTEAPNLAAIPKEIQKKSSRYQRGYAKTSLYRTVQQAQFLDNANQRLTELESSHLIERLLADNTNTATQLLITLSTGSEPAFWYNWSLKGFSSDFWLDISAGYWATPVDIGKKYFKPDTEVSHLFLPTSRYFIRPLPDELKARLLSINNLSATTLGELFSKSAQQISEDCDAWIGRNNPFDRHITLAKIRNHLFFQIMHRTFDEAKANHIVAQRIQKEPQSLAYTTFKSNELISAYQTALPQLSFSSLQDKFSFIGSKALLKEEQLVKLTAEIANELINTKKQLSENDRTHISDLIAFHNLYVSHVFLFGLIITSHRPRTDSFARWLDFILDMNAVVISDKIVDEKHLARISFYDDTFKNQINAYHSHLKTLLETLEKSSKSSPTLSEYLFDDKNTNMPFLFFMQQKGNTLEIQSVGEGSLRKQLAQVNPVWQHIPLNFGRHFLATKLRELGINPEYINYQLGHISVGEEPYSSQSALSVRIVSKILQPALNDITKSLSLRSIFGIDDLKSMTTFDNSLEIKLPTNKIGPLLRIEKYKKAALEERRIARDIYNSNIKFVTEDLGNETFQMLAKDAVQTVIQKSHLRVAENLRFITSRLQVKARKYGWIFEPSIALMKMQVEETPFDYRDIHCWHQIQSARKRFIQHLLEIEFAEASYIQLVTLLFISIQLHTRLIDENRLEKLLDALKKREFYFYKDRIYFELTTREKQIQRVAIDLCSSLLLNQILKKNTRPVTFSHLASNIKKTVENVLDVELSDFKKGIAIDANLSMPSALAAVQKGHRKVASISKESLLRVRSKKRLAEPTENEHEVKIDATLLNLSTNTKPLETEFDLQTQLKQLRNFSSPLRASKKISRKELKSSLIESFESKIKPNAKLAQITKLACIWLIFRVDAPGVKKADLAYSTINGYFYASVAQLIEHIEDSLIQSYQVNELVEIYNEIISTNPTENQANIAQQLYLFHIKICTDLYKLDPIEIDDLIHDSEGSGTEPRIKATLVMPWEITHAINMVDKSVKEPYVKIQTRAILNLYSRFGFRPSELMDIEPQDVKETYLSIRWNRLGRLKNPQSFRNVLFKGKWGSSEQENISDCQALHSDDSKIKFDRFWLNNFKSKTQDKNHFLQIINLLIKKVSGDPQHNIYTLRHSAATLEIMNFFALTLAFEDIEHDLEKEFKIAAYYSDPKGSDNSHSFDSFVKSCFGHKHPSRRHIYRTGRSFGHKTALSTLTNYSHFYEFLMPYYFIEDFKKETQKLIVHLSEKSNDAIKSLRKRQQNSAKLTKQLVLQLVREQKEIQNLSSQEATLLTSRMPKSISMPPEHSELSASLLYQALLYLKSNPSPDPKILMSRFLLNEDKLIRLQQTYHQLFLQTAFDPFHFRCTVDGDFKFDSQDRDNTSEVIKFSNPFGVLERDIDDELLSLWSQYFHPKHNFWHFETDEQTKQFITLLEKAGVSKDRISLGSDDNNKCKSISPTIGIPFRYAKGACALANPRLLNPNLIEKKPGVIISSQTGKRFLNGQLNLAFFLKKIMQVLSGQ